LNFSKLKKPVGTGFFAFYEEFSAVWGRMAI